jgi:hypothetical protein
MFIHYSNCFFSCCQTSVSFRLDHFLCLDTTIIVTMSHKEITRDEVAKNNTEDSLVCPGITYTPEHRSRAADMSNFLSGL